MRPFTAALLIAVSTAIVALPLSIAGADGASAVLSSLKTGTAIRLEMDRATLVEGLFHGLQGDSLVLKLDKRSTTWDLSSVTTVWQRRESRTRGALIGGAIGAVALGIAGYNAAQDPGCFFECNGWTHGDPSTLDLASSAAFAAIVGFGIGAGVGALVIPKAETWVQIFPQPRSPWSVRTYPPNNAVAARGRRA